MQNAPVIALDIGTSSVRAALFDLRGRRLPETLHQRAYALRTDGEGRAELDPDELLRQVRACLRAASRGHRTISGVGVSCFWHSFLGTDAAGNPLTPVYTWADSRCREDAARLRTELSERDVHVETGCMLRSSFWPAKLRWLRRTDRALFRKVRYWMSPGEWVQWQLTGASRCAIGMATGTGLFDPSRLAWSERLMNACQFDADRMLPVGEEPTDWRGVPWFPAIGDGAASNLGSGATQPGRGAINVGTSAAVRILREGPKAVAPFGLFAYRVDARRFLVGGAVSNAGNLHAWCRNELRLGVEGAALERALAARPFPKHGLTVLPYWTAERAPTWDDTLTGVIAGIRQSSTALDLLQAITEASYFRLAVIAETIGGTPPPKWVVSGGILRSRSSLQRLASILGRTIYINPEVEASLRGAAVFALEKLGFAPAPLKYGPGIVPSTKAHRIYLAERCRQSELAERLALDA